MKYIRIENARRKGVENMLLVNGCETVQSQAEIKKLIVEEKVEEKVETKKPVANKKPAPKRAR
jgi:hypothetical protein